MRPPPPPPPPPHLVLLRVEAGADLGEIVPVSRWRTCIGAMTTTAVSVGDAIPTPAAVNPLHIAAMELVEQKERELEASKATIEKLEKENEILKHQQKQQQPPLLHSIDNL